MTINLKENERLDDLQRDGYQIISNAKYFCFGIDAVILAAYAVTRKNDNAIDLGTGNGIIPVLMDARYHNAHITGLEIQEYNVDMAQRSIALNGIGERVSVVQGDIKEASSIFGCGKYDVVTSNPPYMNVDHGLTNPDMCKAIARHELLCTLEDVVREASRLLREGGHFYMIHRPHRLAEIFAQLKDYKLEPKRMRLVYPFVNKEANMVLIDAVKGANPMLKVESPLIVYERAGEYTQEMKGIHYGKE
jgi:tRNA1Val (adenine37-N6)-methyltransferase